MPYSITATIMFFILSSQLSWAQDMRAGEVASDQTKVDRTLQDYFASEITQVYSKSFQENVETFNGKKRTVNDVLKANKDIDAHFKKKARPYLKESLPQIVIKEERATIELGKNIITFSTQSMLEGHVFVNEQKVFLENFSSQELPLIKTVSIEESPIDRLTNLIISKAFASNNDKFEVLIISTLIALKDDFDTSWCMFDSCREQRAKRNFEKVMHEIHMQSIKCRNNDMSFDLVRNLEDYSRTQMSLSLKEKLTDQFFSYPEAELTCQKMVEKFRADTIKEKTHRIERRGYGGVDSYTAELNKTANDKAFQAYIQETCKPYVELRNCLIDKHPKAQAVHDNARGGNKRGLWKSYQDDYQVTPRGQGGQR